MFDLDVPPAVVEVLGDQAAMSAVRLVLAAQQTTGVQEFARNRLFHAARAHEVD